MSKWFQNVQMVSKGSNGFKLFYSIIGKSEKPFLIYNLHLVPPDPCHVKRHICVWSLLTLLTLSVTCQPCGFAGGRIAGFLRTY